MFLFFARNKRLVSRLCMHEKGGMIMRVYAPTCLALEDALSRNGLALRRCLSWFRLSFLSGVISDGSNSAPSSWSAAIAATELSSVQEGQ